MVSIQVRDLGKNTLYTQVLRVSEYICEEFNLAKYFGIISQANQSIVEYVMNHKDDFSLKMFIGIHVNKISINFVSSIPIFDSLLDDGKMNVNYHQDFTFLANSFEIKSDYTEVTYTFHVKPRIRAEKYIPVGVLQRANISK